MPHLELISASLTLCTFAVVVLCVCVCVCVCCVYLCVYCHANCYIPRLRIQKLCGFIHVRFFMVLQTYCVHFAENALFSSFGVMLCFLIFDTQPSIIYSRSCTSGAYTVCMFLAISACGRGTGKCRQNWFFHEIHTMLTLKMPYEI